MAAERWQPVLAPRDLPPEFAAWNARHHAPSGRRGTARVTRLLGRSMPALRYGGAFAWQANNSTRRFEYPWVHRELGRFGARLFVTELGGGISGLQYVLASEGHTVVNVDPGEASGWSLDAGLHQRLGRALGVTVSLVRARLSHAAIPSESQDAVISVSALEHFSEADIEEVCSEIPRILRPEGVLVLTVDLFLDLFPFTSVKAHDAGRNIDLHEFLDASGLELIRGDPSQLFGFPGFDAAGVQRRLARYMVGEYYPTLTQSLVACRPG